MNTVTRVERGLDTVLYFDEQNRYLGQIRKNPGTPFEVVCKEPSQICILSESDVVPTLPTQTFEVDVDTTLGRINTHLEAERWLLHHFFTGEVGIINSEQMP